MRMPAHLVRGGSIGVLLIALACETRNPSEVARQRQPSPGEAAPPAVAAAEEAKLLEGARAADLSIPVATRAAKIDVAAAQMANTLTVGVNAPGFASRLGALFDGDPTTLSRTEGVNPLALIFEFQQPIRLQAVRMYPSYSTCDWGVEAAQGQEFVAVRGASPEAWSVIALKEPVETRQVRVVIRRLQRDDFVHVNEIELLAEPARER